jgi:hypothetical protein
MKKITLLVIVTVLMTLFLAGNAFAAQELVEAAVVTAQDATATPEAEPEPTEEPAAEPESTETPAAEPEPTEAPGEEAAPAEEMAEPGEAAMEVPVEIPFLSAWVNSPHNAAEDEAFVHWNEDDPAEVPANCAKCHSTPGMIDYLGADGSEPLVVDAAAPTGTTVECMACHNEVATELDSVLMPSGIVLTGLGPEARCMECHQGRASTTQVLEAVAGAETPEDFDTVNEELGFINIHYYAAAATKYGTLAKGGFEYPGQSYEGFFVHVPGVSACVDCHQPHSTELDLEKCATCHNDVESVEDLYDVRMNGSLVDYDGDGDIEEGVYYELEGMRETLYQAIQNYAAEVVGTAIVYDTASHPYFFADSDGDGAVDAEPQRYSSWTPRLLEAAYNYQVSLKDPGAFAHGGKYILQLMYDSIADLNSALPEAIDMAAMQRNDVGHFNGAEEAFRHWDAEGTVPGSCTKCHTGDGLPFFLGESVTVSGAPSNGLQCNTCHSDMTTWDLYAVEAVEFPSGAVLTSEGTGDNLCMNCHQGRESGVSIETRVRDLEVDVVAEQLRFVNPHYFAAGATRFGSEANGAYQYEGKEYFGYFEHVGRYDSCTECHNAHVLEVDWEDCEGCHEGVVDNETLANIREYEDDFDGDGDIEEGIAGEIATMEERLYEAIQTYAAETAGTPLFYDASSYPYFFADANANDAVDEGEEGFASWTPRLLKAAYNYQYVQKDPGAFAHNGQYIIQVLYDSLEDLGVDVSGMVRPE